MYIGVKISHLKQQRIEMKTKNLIFSVCPKHWRAVFLLRGYLPQWI
jgi:hypothetical protein